MKARAMSLSPFHMQPRAGFITLVRRLARWGLHYIERGQLMRPFGPDMTALLQADDRMLKDIGLTRGDMQAVAHCDVMARAAAARRNEAIASAEHRSAVMRAAAARQKS